MLAAASRDQPIVAWGELEENMQIAEYDEVDPLGVLNLNLLSLGYALTPERVTLIRQLDRRPFPFFALYAIVDEVVAGQVAVYRLPMVTTHGLEDVGGICAVSTHPAFSRRGIAERLMEEAHLRMLAAGLRFSTLGTARHRGAYQLSLRQGYETVFAPAQVFGSRESILRSSSLHAEHAAHEKLALTDGIFENVARGHLGFARRQKDFLPMLAATGDLNAEDIWILRRGDQPVGYAIAHLSESVLRVSNFVLVKGIDPTGAIAALAQVLDFSYLQLRADVPSAQAALQRAGYALQNPDWSVFMIKPLRPDLTLADARRLLGVGTEAFLISWMDVT